MRCPLCNLPMQPGTTSISPSIVGMIFDIAATPFGGMGSGIAHYLYFNGEIEGETTYVDHSRPAFRCGRCETVLISGSRQEDSMWKQSGERIVEAADTPASNCPACGAAITSQMIRCAECDIALK